MRTAINALALVDEAAHRDQPVAVAKNHRHELRDLRWVRLVAEHIHLRNGIVEIPPWVEMDQVFFGLVDGRRRVGRRVVIVVIITHFESLKLIW